MHGKQRYGLDSLSTTALRCIAVLREQIPFLVTLDAHRAPLANLVPGTSYIEGIVAYLEDQVAGQESSEG